MISRFIIILLVLCFTSTTSMADNDAESKHPLYFGMLPYISTPRLIKIFKPLKIYLENKLHREIKLVTAPNFKEYLNRSLAGEYDFYHTAPHFAAFAELDYDHHRLSRYKRMLDGSIVVRKSGSIDTVMKLKNKIIAAPDKLAVITMLGEKYLHDRGLISGTNISIHNLESHGNAILSVSTGDNHAAIVSSGVFDRMPADVKSKLTILAKTEKIPHVMFMAKKTLPDNDYQILKKSLLEFTAHSYGKEFFKENKRTDMITITDKDINILRPYVKSLRKRLN